MMKGQMGAINTEILTKLYSFIFYFLIFLFIVTLAAYLIYRHYKGKSEEGEEGDVEALEVLNKRYARGEITREEYRERKREIE